MRLSLFIATTILAASILATAAQAETCETRSFQRNSIYKRAGYCFKTAAQIRIFGNAGCQFDNQADVPLSARDRAMIGEIMREERYAGCR